MISGKIILIILGKGQRFLGIGPLPTLWLFRVSLRTVMDFPGGSTGNESICNVGDLGSIPGLGRSPGEGNGYPLQYSGPENSMDCIVQGVARSQTRLSNFHFSELSWRLWVYYLASVLQWANTEAQGLLEVKFSATLGLFRFQSVFVNPVLNGCFILLMVVPCLLSSCLKSIPNSLRLFPGDISHCSPQTDSHYATHLEFGTAFKLRVSLLIISRTVRYSSWKWFISTNSH